MTRAICTRARHRSVRWRPSPRPPCGRTSCAPSTAVGGIGQPVGDGLERGDGDAEGVALARVFDPDLHGAAGPPRPAARRRGRATRAGRRRRRRPPRHRSPITMASAVTRRSATGSEPRLPGEDVGSVAPLGDDAIAIAGQDRHRPADQPAPSQDALDRRAGGQRAPAHPRPGPLPATERAGEVSERRPASGWRRRTRPGAPGPQKRRGPRSRGRHRARGRPAPPPARGGPCRHRRARSLAARAPGRSRCSSLARTTSVVALAVEEPAVGTASCSCSCRGPEIEHHPPPIWVAPA